MRAQVRSKQIRGVFATTGVTTRVPDDIEPQLSDTEVLWAPKQLAQGFLDVAVGNEYDQRFA